MRRADRSSTPISIVCAVRSSSKTSAGKRRSRGAITIVEWPERIAAALPADRLEVRIRFDPARGPGLARPGIARLRSDGQATGSALGVGALLKRAGWSEARREFLQGDASIRAYERLTQARRRDRDPDDFSAAARRANPALRQALCGDRQAFARHPRLHRNGRRPARAAAIRPPRLIAYSVDEGLALIEDLGDDDQWSRTGVPNGARYAEAVALLVDLHGRDLPDSLPAGDEIYRLPTYDVEAMLVEVELAIDWYAPAVARVTVPSGARMQFLAIWRELLQPILAEPTTWTLRDYHSPNLHWLPQREGVCRIGLIDFQDAVIGPPAYDLASLLQDARVDVPDDLEMRLAALYVRRRSAADPEFRRRALRRRLCGDGGAARDQNPRHFRAARQARRQAAVPAPPAADRALSRQEPRASVA